MKFTVNVDGDWEALTKAEIKAGQVAVSRGIEAAGQSLKNLWRNQVTSAGLGTRLGNSIRSESYPKGQPSLNAAALIYSKAPKLISAFDEGPTITAQNGFWLAIPLGAAKNMKGAKGRKITPGEWEQRTGRRLTFIYRAGRSGLLVDTGKVVSHNYMDKKGFHRRRGAGRKNVTIPVFALVPRVKLAKRLDLATAANAAASTVPGLIIGNWRR